MVNKKRLKEVFAGFGSGVGDLFARGFEGQQIQKGLSEEDFLQQAGGNIGLAVFGERKKRKK